MIKYNVKGENKMKIDNVYVASVLSPLIQFMKIKIMRQV